MATAYYLEQQARSKGYNLQCRLLERSDQLGGKIRTEQVGRFLTEAGPDSLLTRKPWGINLCREVGLDHDLLPGRDVPHKTYILWEGRQIPLPPGVQLGVPTQLAPLAASPLLSWPGKLRALADLFMWPRRDTDDESIAQFFQRHFGKEVVDRIVAPMLGSIYAGDVQKLSLASTFPTFKTLEYQHGSLIRGLRKQTSSESTQASPFTTLRRGMTSLVTSIVERLSMTTLYTSWPVSRVIPAQTDGWTVYSHVDNVAPLHADAVVVASPACDAAKNLHEALPDAADELAQIPFSSSATVNLGFHSAIPDTIARGYGFIVAPMTKGLVSGGTWAMNKFEHRCAPGQSILRLFLGGAAKTLPMDHRKHDAWLEPALRFCHDHLSIHTKPDEVRVAVWDQANPQYNVGHMDRMRRMEVMFHRTPGMYITGSSLTGFSVSDCVRDAQRVARDVLDDVAADNV